MTVLEVSYSQQFFFSPGLISRSEAEAALSGCAAGSFLVRVSERVWGYAVTYRDPTRCKHFLVEAARSYRLLPTGHAAHDTLGMYTVG